MTAATVVVALVALILPFSPAAGVLGFTSLSPKILLALLVIIVLYLASAEIVKRWFFRRYAQR